MQIIPTQDPTANRDTDKIVIGLGDNTSLALTLNQALHLHHRTRRVVHAMLAEVSQIEPPEAEVIKFPVHATRRAAQ